LDFEWKYNFELKSSHNYIFVNASLQKLLLKNFLYHIFRTFTLYVLCTIKCKKIKKEFIQYESIYKKGLTVQISEI